MLIPQGLKKPEVQEVVLQQEALRERSFFAHSMKLYTIVSKARTEDNVVWVFRLIQDYYLSGELDPAKISTADLEGRNKQGSLVEAWVLKKQMLAFLVGEVLTKTPIKNDVKQAIRDATCDCKSLREKVGFPGQVVSQVWRSGWPKSAVMMLQMIQDRRGV